ncbi:MAG: trimeric intracellular cation channel family protein [Melioribacteraceae bacterium]|nr:MAG: trimeric intracellular cation channel family protein [Melioribacteraceae bacterium]
MKTIYFFDLLGGAVFAISGALMAGRKQMDLFGVLVLAGVTAMGGGTVRDLLLDKEVFWLHDINYIIVILAAALGTVLLKRTFKITNKVLLIADAFGLAFFSVLGTAKALSFEFSPLIAIIMGVVTGVVGGAMRDILCGEVPLILRKDIYATAAVLGGSVYSGLIFINFASNISLIIALLSAAALRLAAIKWNFGLPVFNLPINDERDKFLK